MKRFLYFILLISAITNAQDLESILSNDLCECFNENENDEDIELELLKTCFNSSLEKNKEKLISFVTKGLDTTKINSDDAYELGYQFGQKLFGDIQERTINECDSYYNYTSNISKIIKKNLAKESNQKEVDSISKLIVKNPENIDLIWERGIGYIGLQDYKSAQLDFNNYLEKNNTHVPVMFFLALSYHFEGNSKKAIEGYEIILNQDIELGSMGDMTKMFLAVLKRKSREEK